MNGTHLGGRHRAKSAIAALQHGADMPSWHQAPAMSLRVLNP